MVSVIIPTHNRADLLPRAIKSVQKQTIKNLEIIIVSDGSTDETDMVMKDLTSKDERIKYISYTPSKGGNHARNMGIEASSSEYIAFLDDDDEWMPSKLEEQLNIMNSNPNIGIVYTGVHVIYVEDHVNYSFIPDMHGYLSTKILLDNYIGSTSTVMVKRAALDNSGLFDEELPALQDFDLWIRICQHMELGVVSKELVNYYNYRNTCQVSSSTDKYEKAFAIIESKYKEQINNLNESEKKERIKNKLFLLGNKAMRNNNSSLARSYFFKLLKTKYSTKALLYYFLTFTNFTFILKLRSLI